jgi:hypothetical protein
MDLGRHRSSTSGLCSARILRPFAWVWGAHNYSAAGGCGITNFPGAWHLVNLPVFPEVKVRRALALAVFLPKGDLSLLVLFSILAYRTQWPSSFPRPCVYLHWQLPTPLLDRALLSWVVPLCTNSSSLPLPRWLKFAPNPLPETPRNLSQSPDLERWVGNGGGGAWGQNKQGQVLCALLLQVSVTPG